MKSLFLWCNFQSCLCDDSIFVFHFLNECSTIEQQGPSSSDVPSTSPVQRSVIHKPFTQSRIPPDLPMHPAPRHITEEELSVLEGCLHRWRTEVENDTRGNATHWGMPLLQERILCKAGKQFIQEGLAFGMQIDVAHVKHAPVWLFVRENKDTAMCNYTALWKRGSFFSLSFRFTRKYIQNTSDN